MKSFCRRVFRIYQPKIEAIAKPITIPAVPLNIEGKKYQSEWRWVEVLKYLEVVQIVYFLHKFFSLLGSIFNFYADPVSCPYYL